MTGVSIIQFAETSSTITVAENRATILQGVENVGPPGAGSSTATYVTLSTNADLANERVLTAGTGIDLTDAGAGSTVTVDVDPSEFGNGTVPIASLASTPLLASNNLSDVTAATARTNLGLGGLATLSAVGSSEITNGSITNDDINASAAIALSKLASISTARILGRTTSGSGAIEELSQSAVFGFLGTGTPSGTTYLRGDGTWSTPAGGGSVATDTIFDAKGDLAVGTGADTASRLAVGTNGTIPAARAGQSTGIGWVDAIPPGRVKGGGTTFYSLPGVVIVAANSSLLHTDARIYYHPIVVHQGQSLTFDQVACEVSGAGAGSAIRLGLYTADEDLQPLALVADFGTVDSTGTGVKTISSTQTLTPGRYLLCSIQQGGSNATLRSYRGNVAGWNGIASTLGATGAGYTLQKSTSGISGALPGTPVAWDTMLTQVTPHEYPILLRISDPSAG